MGSIRIRLTLFFVGIFGSALILLAAVGYRFIIEKQQADFDAALYNHAIDLASILDKDYFATTNTPPSLPEHVITPLEEGKVLPFSLKRSQFVVRTYDGQVLARSSETPHLDIPLSPSIMMEVRAHGINFSNLPGQESFRLLTTQVLKPPRPLMILQIAAPMTFLALNEEKVRQFIFLMIPLVVLIATLGGLLLANRALAPVGAMSDTADQIQVGNLSQRLPVPPTKDELRQLALTFNRMLDRIEKTVNAHERFVADASHQLKTPLSILRGELDWLLRNPRPPEETQRFLASASQEIDNLTRLSENLLILARIDSGQGALVLREIAMEEIVLECVTKLSRPAKEKHINIQLHWSPEESYSTEGDPDLLYNVVQNLFENAIKYTPANGKIQGTLQFVTSATGEKRIQLCVDDSGSGIPEAERARIFERFFRGPSSSPHTKGSGLGLSIARSIAEVHQGSLHAEQSPLGGARFVLELKLI